MLRAMLAATVFFSVFLSTETIHRTIDLEPRDGTRGLHHGVHGWRVGQGLLRARVRVGAMKVWMLCNELLANNRRCVKPANHAVGEGHESNLADYFESLRDQGYDEEDDTTGTVWRDTLPR